MTFRTAWFERAIRRRRPFIRQRRPPAYLWAILALIILLIYRLAPWPGTKDSFSFDSAGPYYVRHVIDGDTLALEGGEHVRLLGVNTPEIRHPTKPVEPFGVEATEFTRAHTEHRMVTLQFDRERRDAYRRVLAYVYVDKWFLNEELILAGYSRAQTQFPYSESMKRRFRQAEHKAREQRRGIWQLSDAALPAGTNRNGTKRFAK